MAEDTKLPLDANNEIATVAKDITYLAFQGILRSRDATLETRGGNRSYAIYDDIERDCHAYGVLQKRKLAVVARPWQVDPASNDTLDIKAADMVRAQLSAIGVPAADNPGDQVVMASNFDLVCFNLLDSILKGFAVGEIMWDIDGKEIVAREIRPKDQRRFNFDTDYKLRLKTWSQLIPGETVPPRKFIVHTFGAKDGSPYGIGVGSRLFWPTFFKRQDITFWLTYLDKFGSPTAVGKYPGGTPAEQQKDLLNALAAISQDAGVTVPDNMVIELLEAKRSGTVTYEQFARYMDEEMTFAVLGEAPTSKGGGGAQQTAALAREEVRLELVQADADLLSATLNATLSPWLTAYNVPGARPPKIWRQVQEAEDLKARSERDRNLFVIGFRPTLAEVTKTYGGEWEAVPPAVVRKTDALPAAFAEAGDNGPFTDDLLANRLAVESAKPWTDTLVKIKSIVDSAASLEDLRDALIGAFGNLPQDELVKVMQAGFAVADLVGMADVADGQ
ncbi:DUF935 domain-containing protein [Sulfuriferula sp. AH1]|uniref:DUF935 domain-containing protein n=1 Tax=Sulfuriferula sp. AH1 TaxID=1985873 RepID=UPI0012F9493A|nr:DUF935 family protein [Sulfuriferula sp. AH1]